jgi:beta-galactosidase
MRRITLGLQTLCVLLSACVSALLARETILLDAGWRFQLGENPQATAPLFADEVWQAVDLPHDWSIGFVPEESASSEGHGGFFPTGVGCYRRTFTIAPEWRGQRIALEFEGVAGRTAVWLNGKRLGDHHYAYTPIRFDITDQVNFDDSNVLVVQVDNSHQPNSRWYVGSGIYRHVWLQACGPVHIAHQGVRLITHETSAQEATVEAVVTVENLTDAEATVRVEAEFISPAGESVAELESTVQTAAGQQTPAGLSTQISQPNLWSPDSPDLYTVRIRVQRGEEVLDTLEVPLGIRTVRVSAERGLLLNGQSIEMCGGCVHHDNGPLGAAAYDRAELRRVELLKRAGFNAIRTSHNPPSTAFLNACDRLGMLVIDEAFDGWAVAKTKHDYSNVFADQWQTDLQAMIDRDRNHPAVVMWSIGNEVYERGDESGRQLAGELARFARQHDATRPVTIALCGLSKTEDWPKLDPMFAAVDAAGYNYELHRYAKDHERVPQRVMFSSESFPFVPYVGWKASTEVPYVIGDFVWTALDYLGEAGIGRVYFPDETVRGHWEGSHFPWRGAACGDIDLVGFRKPLSHYRNIVWDRGEHLYAAVRLPTPDGRPWQLSKWSQEPALASWTWPGQEGKPLSVVIFSRYEKVRVYLNDSFLCEKPTGEAQEFRAQCEIPYTPGCLKVVGWQDGQAMETCHLTTAGSHLGLRLKADRPAIQADGQDLAFVTVELVDATGNVNMQDDQTVQFTLSGPGKIVAVGNADLIGRESYQANPHRTYQGRALVVVRSTSETGVIELRAEAKGLPKAKVKIVADGP